MLFILIINILIAAIKDPPYSLKESGYAGFLLPVDIYLKNREEPKKHTCNYDLILHSSGPYSSSRREELIIQNPTDEFRRKLLKGGGVIISNTSSGSSKQKDFNDERSQLISKPKLGGSGDSGELLFNRFF